MLSSVPSYFSNDFTSSQPFVYKTLLCSPGYRLLATSSRDRLIHIFDIEKDFALIQTVDDHASSVTAVRFNCE